MKIILYLTLCITSTVCCAQEVSGALKTGLLDALQQQIDRNGGGSPDMVQLISSYLFEEPVHLNSIRWRRDRRTVDYWTLEKVNGQRQADTPVYLLTSSGTFSAAEEFAYNLQATVVGETTRGGANPWRWFDLPQGFAVAIPIAMAINPITHANWEGSGVSPDRQTARERALDTAHALALAAIQHHRLPAGQQRDIRDALATFKVRQPSTEQE